MFDGGRKDAGEQQVFDRLFYSSVCDYTQFRFKCVVLGTYFSYKLFGLSILVSLDLSKK